LKDFRFRTEPTIIGRPIDRIHVLLTYYMAQDRTLQI
jgi:hypothetical protein